MHCSRFSELFACFTTPGEGKRLAKSLSGQCLDSLPLTSENGLCSSSERIQNHYFSLLHVIQHQICTFQPSQSTLSLNNDLSHKFVSYYSVDLPASPFLEKEVRTYVSLKVIGNSLVVASSSSHTYPELRQTNKDTEEELSVERLLDFEIVKTARKNYQREKKLTKCSPIPIIIVVLDENDFSSFLSESSSSEAPLLPSLLPNCYANNQDAKSKKKHFWGLPQDISLESEVNDERGGHLCCHYFPGSVYHDNEGPIAFVSSSFVLHSFFFRHFCLVQDFLWDPIKGSLVMKQQATGLELLIEEARINTNCPEQVEQKRKRERNGRTKTCASVSLCEMDDAYIERKLKQMREAQRRGEAPSELLKIALSTLQPTDLPNTHSQNQNPLEKEMREEKKYEMNDQHFSTLSLLRSVLMRPLSVDKKKLENSPPPEILFSRPDFLPFNDNSSLTPELGDIYSEHWFSRSSSLNTDSGLLSYGRSLVEQLDPAHDTTEPMKDSRSTVLLAVLERRKCELSHLMNLVENELISLKGLGNHDSDHPIKSFSLLHDFWNDVAEDVLSIEFQNSCGEEQKNNREWSGREALHLFLQLQNFKRTTKRPDNEGDASSDSLNDSVKLMMHWKSHLVFLLMYDSEGNEVKTTQQSHQNESQSFLDALRDTALTGVLRSGELTDKNHMIRKELALLRVLWSFSLSIKESLVGAQTAYMERWVHHASCRHDGVKK